MFDDSLLLIALALLALGIGGIATFSVYLLKKSLPGRLGRMEEALRVYNTANATLGRQLAELEAEIARLREKAANRPVAAVQEPPARHMTAAERYGISGAAGEPAAGFSEAELRLAQLIKSRLASMRLN